MNKIKLFFKNLISSFSVREITIIIATFVVSVSLIVGGATYKKEGSERVKKPIFPSVRVYDIYGTRRGIFDTSFYVQYEETVREEEINEVIEVLNEYLVPYHCLFDRHTYYFKEAPVVPNHPTPEERETLLRYNNLKVINDNIGSEVVIDEPLYDILEKAIELSVKTNGRFNPYVGKLYDFWSLKLRPGKEYNTSIDPLYDSEEAAKLVYFLSFVPKTKEDIESTLTLRKDENKYYAKLNSFNGAGKGDLEITLGGVAKGYMEDILKEVMISRGLTRGIINGGTSSFLTLQDTFYTKPHSFNMACIIPEDSHLKEMGISYNMTLKGTFGMSTSGTYTGNRFIKDDVHYLRSHIIDPFTGYPANNTHELSNAISNELSGMELDALTTALLVYPLDEAITFLENTYSNIDLEYLFLLNEVDDFYVVKSSNYPGQKEGTFTLFSPYREKNNE
ncbi:MAG: hypothetical protein GX343_02210 [Erysipelotrichaceae bacterium]|jgi:thiamine biosynthesis lipoprotein ApbE|nr:hypothetical protein [Erysipelotrichaceae bacterium]